MALLNLSLTYSFNHSVTPEDSISLTYQGATINYPENGGISYTDNGDGTATLINILLEVDSDPVGYDFLIELTPAEFPGETITGVVTSTGDWVSPQFAALPWGLSEVIQVSFNYVIPVYGCTDDSACNTCTDGCNTDCNEDGDGPGGNECCLYLTTYYSDNDGDGFGCPTDSQVFCPDIVEDNWVDNDYDVDGDFFGECDCETNNTDCAGECGGNAFILTCDAGCGGGCVAFDTECDTPADCGECGEPTDCEGGGCSAPDYVCSDEEETNYCGGTVCGSSDCSAPSVSCENCGGTSTDCFSGADGDGGCDSIENYNSCSNHGMCGTAYGCFGEAGCDSIENYNPCSNHGMCGTADTCDTSSVSGCTSTNFCGSCEGSNSDCCGTYGYASSSAECTCNGGYCSTGDCPLPDSGGDFSGCCNDTDPDGCGCGESYISDCTYCSLNAECCSYEEPDCAGICGGDDVIDQCGVCGGNDISNFTWSEAGHCGGPGEASCCSTLPSGETYNTFYSCLDGYGSVDDCGDCVADPNNQNCGCNQPDCDSYCEDDVYYFDGYYTCVGGEEPVFTCHFLDNSDAGGCLGEGCTASGVDAGGECMEDVNCSGDNNPNCSEPTPNCNPIDNSCYCSSDDGVDCAGICGGLSVEDECGVCGDNEAVALWDCAAVGDPECGGATDQCDETIDYCGTGNCSELYPASDGTDDHLPDCNVSGFCECAAHSWDCDGVCGGETINYKNNCGGGGTSPDTNCDNGGCGYDCEYPPATCGELDDFDCGTPTGCDGLGCGVLDCLGECGGSATICDVIAACNYGECADCEYVDGYLEDTNIVDCNGDCCTMDNASYECRSQSLEVDCNGVCNGEAVLDDCDVCSEGNTEHIPNSDMDDCGDCFGNIDAETCSTDEAGVEWCDCACIDTGLVNGCCDEDEELGCGCGEAGPSGCDNVCGSTATDQGCGCDEEGPVTCAIGTETGDYCTILGEEYCANIEGDLEFQCTYQMDACNIPQCQPEGKCIDTDNDGICDCDDECLPAGNDACDIGSDNYNELATCAGDGTYHTCTECGLSACGTNNCEPYIVCPDISGSGDGDCSPQNQNLCNALLCVIKDECGVCDGDNSTCCTESIACNYLVTSGETYADGDCWVEDCLGECGGNNNIDDCRLCGLWEFDTSSTLRDCNDDCFGCAVLDDCGICGGPGAEYVCWDDSVVCDVSNCPTEPAECFEYGFVGCDEECYMVPTIQDVPQEGKYDICGTCGGEENECDACCANHYAEACEAGPCDTETDCDGIQTCFQVDQTETIEGITTIIQWDEHLLSAYCLWGIMTQSCNSTMQEGGIIPKM